MAEEHKHDAGASQETERDPRADENHDESESLTPYVDLVAQLRAEDNLDVPAMADVVEQQEAADAADTLEDLEEEQAAEVLVEMEHQAAADALSEMEIPLAVGVVEDLVDEGNADYAMRLMLAMAPDDAVDLLQAAPDSYREELLAKMAIDRATKLRRLISYDEESAGGIMTTDFISLLDSNTIAEATKEVRRHSIPEEIHHLPITASNGCLEGMISLRDLVIHPADKKIADIMDREVEALKPEMDREEVARDFDRYDHAMMPVVDDANRLIGIVTFDDVIDIIRREQTEDVQKTVGAGAAEAVYSTIGEKFRGRFPWLGASLVMTALAAAVVLVFEDLIARRPILAFLMPVIAALVGNAGHQALAVTLRGIVLDQVRPDRVLPLVLREGAIGLLNGFVLGVLMCVGMAALGSTIIGADWKIGMIAGIAAMLAMGVGTLAGSCIPLIMRRLGADPAQSSAIFLIMITDAVSFTALLTLTLLTLEVAE